MIKNRFIPSFMSGAALAVLLSSQAFAALNKLPPAAAAPLPPVQELTAGDMPYDAGGVALLEWKAMPYDGAGVIYQVLAATASAGPWKQTDEFQSGQKFASDVKLPFWAWRSTKKYHAVPVDLSAVFSPVSTSDTYFFKVISASGPVSAGSEVVSTAANGNWFNLARLNNLFLVVFLTGVFLWMISHAKRRHLFIRRIAGLDAVDEALGRATEMGRPIYYTTGISGMTDMSTIASTFILAEVAKKVAQYDTQIKIPHYDPITMSVCKEITKQAYMEAGRPDSYREDINVFISSDQFAYAAAVDGMITREKPAACFFMGYFLAESLLLTEVGATTGAIQIAGTDSESQLPFFFTSCDYTLIGEELYAAGAYLSKDPVLVGTLRAQDVGKMFVMAAVVLGLAASTLGVIFGWDSFVRVVLDPFHSF